MRINGSTVRLAAAVAVGALALGACTSGASPSQSGNGDIEGAGGLPKTATPADVVKLTTEALAGKVVRASMLTDSAALTQNWSARLELGLEAVGIDFESVASNYDQQLQAQQIQTFIDQGVDALVLHNQDVSSLASLITKAQDAGIYVVVLNLGSNAQSDAFVGPNWEEMAKVLAERVVADCQAKGKDEVAIISGFGSDSGSVSSTEGATKVFEAANFNIVASQPGQYDPSKAGEIARTILQQNPNLCAFQGNWDGMMLGVSKVVSDQGLSGQVGVYTTDDSQPACDAIGEGSMTAAVDYGAGTNMGDTAAAVIKYLLQSGIPAGTARTAIFMPNTIVDQSNYTDARLCYGPIH